MQFLGVFPCADKTWALVKPEHLDRAKELFPDINITAVGREFLGSYIGAKEGIPVFMAGRLEEWSKDIDALVKIAQSEPQLELQGDGNLSAAAYQIFQLN